MRLLANENFPRVAVEALRAIGHDVSWAAEVCPSARDQDVLALAIREARVLVTLDKDFGELAFRSRLPAQCGNVLFRVPPLPELVKSHAVRLLHSNADCSGRFVVVEPTRTRERALPPA